MTQDAFNAYSVLGVPSTATPEEVTTAYRSLAQAEHPDKGGSTDRMTAINLAFEMLSDPEFRARYDASLPLPGDDPALALIKRLIAHKSRYEIIRIRDDIAMHIRSLEVRAVGGRGGFGPEWKHLGYLVTERARLERHKRELAYLESLLALELDQLEAQLKPLKEARA